MVNYDSINLGLKVEFIRNEKICSGTVRYTGGINGKQGVFVGIEADEPGILEIFFSLIKIYQ